MTHIKRERMQINNNNERNLCQIRTFIFFSLNLEKIGYTKPLRIIILDGINDIMNVGHSHRLD